MSDQVPAQRVFIIEAKIAIRANNEKAAQDEIALRLRSFGFDRDTSVEMSYPRSMTPSTPLFSALQRDREAQEGGA